MTSRPARAPRRAPLFTGILGPLLALAWAAGCLKPAPPDGAIACSSRAPACPDGYTCDKGACVRSDHVVTSTCGNDGGADCMDYCNCMSAACTGLGISGEFPDEGTCLSTCCALTTRAVACRLAHCVYARDGISGQPPMPSFHCPHALGAAPCNFP